MRGCGRFLGAGLLGGIATASGIALTATSGWLIVRASERPVILMLLTAIVAVRTFGMARPVFRYWERLRSHDVALTDLADRRTTAYARLIPLTPARLGRRGRADLLTGVVDDLSDVVDADGQGHRAGPFGAHGGGRPGRDRHRCTLAVGRPCCCRHGDRHRGRLRPWLAAGDALAADSSGSACGGLTVTALVAGNAKANFRRRG